MTGEPRQPSYVDLSTEQDARFGGECGICAARYATSGVPIQGMSGAALRDLRKATLSQFDAAWRELQVSCYRCGRGACPECWDSDNRMCVECADARGLVRASYLPPTRGPLADGRLVLTDRGKYSRVEQPAWVGDIIASGRNARGSGLETGVSGAPTVEPWMLALTTTGDLAREVYPDAPFVPVMATTLASEPTEQIPTAPNSQPLPPPVLPPDDGSYTFSPVGTPTGAGAAREGMVTCPRCGTANFDFVTQCTACQLQLVQICPSCEKLNSGQATRCESCGAPLSRPRGWSGVLPPLSPAIIAAMKRDANAGAQQSSNNAMPVSQGAGPTALAQSGGTSGRPTPYLPRARGVQPPAATYTPGGVASATMVPPPAHERGKRRRPNLTAQGGSAGAVAVPGNPGVTPAESMVQLTGPAAKAAAVLDRIAGWLLLVVVVGFVGMIVAAELSTGANAALRGIIHVDIQQTLAHFAQQMQMLWQRIHPSTGN